MTEKVPTAMVTARTLSKKFRIFGHGYHASEICDLPDHNLGCKLNTSSVPGARGGCPPSSPPLLDVHPAANLYWVLWSRIPHRGEPAQLKILLLVHLVHTFPHSLPSQTVRQIYSLVYASWGDVWEVFRRSPYVGIVGNLGAIDTFGKMLSLCLMFVMEKKSFRV